MSNETIDIPATVTPAAAAGQTMALERRPEQAVGKALSMEQLHERLDFIREVMKREMKEGTDYGKIPGTGDKPSLLQPGAQKLLLTFQLREQVKKEVLRDFPNYHREYEFIVTVFPAGGRPDDGWDGVGTCSTLESKYRYRKAERLCPSCKKPKIIAENPQYVKEGEVPGFLCWKKKGGCGARFGPNDPTILNQPSDDVENDDPADCWNTVRKMAFKRALIHAAINSTNTSELWTADLEDMSENEAARPKRQPETSADRFSKAAHNAPRNDSKPSGATKTPPKGQSPQAQSQAKAAGAPKEPPPPADEQTRAKMIRKLDPMLDLATEYFRTLANPTVLLPNETMEDVPLEWVPITTRQMWDLEQKIKGFGNGEPAEHPYPKNPRPEPGKPAQPPSAKTGETKPKASIESAKGKDPEWWRDVICPVPPRGMKRDDYMRAPQTVGWMYENRHDSEVNRRLFGFVNNFTVSKTWVAGDGSTRMRQQSQVDADTLFREALDACKEYGDKHAGDTEHHVASEEGHSAALEAAAAEGQMPPGDDPDLEDDVPF